MLEQKREILYKMMTVFASFYQYYKPVRRLLFRFYKLSLIVFLPQANPRSFPVTNISNACFGPSYSSRDLSIGLTSHFLLRLLVFNIHIYSSSFISFIYLNINAIALMLGNNLGYNCRQML